MTTKEQQIQEFLSQPIKKGDSVTVTVSSYGKTKKEYVQVEAIDGDHVLYKEHGYRELQSCPFTSLERCVKHIGVNPFKPELRATAYQIDTEQLLWRCGFDRYEKEERNEKWLGVRIP